MLQEPVKNFYLTVVRMSDFRAGAQAGNYRNESSAWTNVYSHSCEADK